MTEAIRQFFWRYFSDEDALVLAVTLGIGVLVLLTMGRMLAPMIAALVVAYLLEWAIFCLERLKVPHAVAVVSVFTLFIGLVFFLFVTIFPLLWQQLTTLAHELPHTLGKFQAFLMALPQRYPDYISTVQIQQVLQELQANLTRIGQLILSYSITRIPGIIELAIYLVLVPLLVFFFLKDRQLLLNWFSRFMPRNRKILKDVWHEVRIQIGNYIRGKVLEIIIVTISCYVPFKVMGLSYTMLLSVAVGLSVIIPYIGVVIVTIPVILVAFIQWGWHAKFAYLLVTYIVIVILDGNVLVPLLFAEVVALHPVAIILAVLIFGGFFSFWGVFFAIPLASFVKAVMRAWPVKKLPVDDNKFL